MNTNLTPKRVPIVDRIRQMIARGDLVAGQRLTEAELAERLGVSRTPVRQALPMLEMEHLLVRVGARGYEVRDFDEKNVMDSLDVRGTLEGLAARLVAERGPSDELIEQLRACLAEGDALIADGVPASHENRYPEMNRRFHELILEAADNQVIQQVVRNINSHSLPFAAPDAPVFNHAQREALIDVIRNAHVQHHAIVDALAHRQGARVEALFREHVHAAKTAFHLARGTLDATKGGLSPALVKLLQA
jgi:GntR family transcriptional regulator, vanillate catabolism transcriptional regulator